MFSSRLVGLFATLAALALNLPAAAQSRRVELAFTPTERAQIALWIESVDGERFQTIRLTESIAYRGVGNRPGATQMNSGFRWPFGRREGALPIWAHRRVTRGQAPFPRVIFNGRASEGNASSAGSIAEPRNTRDDYFCLSFTRELSGREALDAMSCASVFMSNKGRYLTETDVAEGYAEPYVEAGTGIMRPMGVASLYPPRRDHSPCEVEGCGDHADTREYGAAARASMPEIDAVTMPTPAGGRAQRIMWDVPVGWPDGEYVVWLEINVEGDWNDTHNGVTNPTPVSPAAAWDFWAMNYGYPYRGQPSVVFQVPITITPLGGTFTASEYSGYASLHGEDGEIRPPDQAVITNTDELTLAGSGADRLHSTGSGRLAATVPPWDVCEQPDPPRECGAECLPGDASCGLLLLCGPDLTCVGICDVPLAPEAVDELTLELWPDERHSHQWAVLSFRAPSSERQIARYEVRVSASPITDLESFERALPAVEANIDNIELFVDASAPEGELVRAEFGGLAPQSRYHIAVRVYDQCNAGSELAVAVIETTEINFTTVSPCFVATAAYGTPMAAEIGALRRFRDRHLRTHAPGRALVAAYHAVGPHLAGAIADDEDYRAAARAALAPLVAFARWLD